MVSQQSSRILLPEEGVIDSLDKYRAQSGLEAYEKVLSMDPWQVIDMIKAAGLRGRGGAGFPTGVKWSGILEQTARRKFAVCNGAEGEPGTFKDRWLLRHNPYQTLEGLAIAARVMGAERAFICIKQRFEPETRALSRALEELQASTHIADNIELVLGPDEYLFGEEKALLEVIEGGLPLPRRFPPYMHGLFSGAYGGPQGNPTAVNNVETLSHVPHIIRNGPDWFRSHGNQDTPGTMVFTLTGDIQNPTVQELPLGMTLRQVIDEVGGGLKPGRKVKAIFSGLANVVMTPDKLDVPLGFDAMRRAGGSLGSAGFIIYDDTACLAQVCYMFAHFLYIESCYQCPPCKVGAREITEAMDRLLSEPEQYGLMDEIMEVTTWCENGARCFLASSTALVVSSILSEYQEDFSAHVSGTCNLRHDLVLPKIVDYVEGQGFSFDSLYSRKQPDWTYVDI